MLPKRSKICTLKSDQNFFTMKVTLTWSKICTLQKLSTSQKWSQNCCRTLTAKSLPHGLPLLGTKKGRPQGFGSRRATPEFLAQEPPVRHTDRTFPVPRTFIDILQGAERQEKISKIFLSSLYRNLTQQKEKLSREFLYTKFMYRNFSY